MSDTGRLAEPLDVVTRGFGPERAGLEAVTPAVRKVLGELTGSVAHDPERREQAIARAMSVWIRRTYEHAPVIIPVEA